MKALLIIGGAGYIGSHVNKLACESGYHTIVLDDLSSGSKDAVVSGELIQGDFGNRELLDSIFSSRRIDAVLHFAAFLDIGESVQDPLKYYENNVSKTVTLLNAMQKHGVRFFVFSSTAAIFGTPISIPIGENHSRLPINPYGKSKLMIEHILKDLKKSYGIDSCSLRYFNAAGADPDGLIKNQKKKEHNLIPLVLQSLKAVPQKTLTIYGDDYETPDGTCIRDYIHVADLAKAHLLALESLFQGTCSSEYNLGNGKGFSVKEVIEAAERVTGLKVKTVIGKRRDGDPPILIADSEKIKRELGWTPRHPDLDTMIKHAWQAMH